MKPFLFLLKLILLMLPTNLKASEQPNHSAIPEGMVLPEKVARMSALFIHAGGDHSFDSRGRYMDNGIKASVLNSMWLMEYGLTKSFSFQILVPYMKTNKLQVYNEKFIQSTFYSKAYQKFENMLLPKMISTFCEDEISCHNLIESGFSLPVEKEFILETGEKLLVTTKKALKENIKENILKQVDFKEGQTGVSDIVLGGLYNILRTPEFIYSMGLGLRIPTGSFSEVASAYRPTGAGFYELGFRLNLDYKPLPGLWLSFSEQHEFALNKATRKKSSFLDPSYLNSETPKDGVSNSKVYEKTTPKRISALKASWGIGAVYEPLKLLVLNASYRYVEDATIHIDHKLEEMPSRMKFVFIGGAIDGRLAGIPIAFEYDHGIPYRGKNAKVAPTLDIYAIKAYARF